MQLTLSLLYVAQCNHDVSIVCMPKLHCYSLHVRLLWYPKLYQTVTRSLLGFKNIDEKSAEPDSPVRGRRLRLYTPANPVHAGRSIYII